MKRLREPTKDQQKYHPKVPKVRARQVDSDLFWDSIRRKRRAERPTGITARGKVLSQPRNAKWGND